MANSYGFDPVAWSIDGGRHRGELLRVLAYAATAGSEGIVSPADCKVHQLGVPGSQVAMDAGALLIRNRSANVRNQTYVANGRVETRLDVTPTPAGAARSDAVMVRIEDPQYAGFEKPAAGQEADWQYVKPFILENVGSGITNATQLNLGYPAVMLARLDLPANTSVVTNSMIKDMRKIAQPRRERRVSSWRVGDGVAERLDIVDVNLRLFPSMQQLVPCPEWATQIKMIVNVGNLLVGGERVTGGMRAEYGWTLPGNPYVYTEHSGIHYAVPPSDAWSAARYGVLIAGEARLPADFRGKDHKVRIGTNLNGVLGEGASRGHITVDEWTTVTVDLEFVEVPE